MAASLLGTKVRLLARITAYLVEAGLVIAAIRIAGAFRFGWIQLWNVSHALGVRRTVELWWAAAYGLVIDHTTNGIQAARMLARITTLLTDASPISRAILVGYTLRITASGGSIVDTANAIAATRRRLARIDGVHLTW